MKLELCDEFFYRVNDENLDIHKLFNTCKENILRNNEKFKLYSGEWIKIKVNNFITHRVKPTETLGVVADIYGVDINKIKQNNNLKSDKLFIGQSLKIFK